MEKNMDEPKLRATIPVPDHSDMRGFSYRGPESEDHPENNEHFVMHREEEDPDILAQEKAELAGDDIDAGKAEMADLNPDDFESDNDLGAGPGASGANGRASADAEETARGAADALEDEDDTSDVLEEVRGGLRADVPEEHEYDDTDSNARRRAG